MQCASAIFSSVACPDLQSIKRRDFRGKKLLNIKRVFWFCIQLSSETSFILRINEQDNVIKVHRSPRNVCRYSCNVLMKLELSRQNFEKYSSTNFVKIRPVGAELFHAGGRTDRHDEVNSRFS